MNTIKINFYASLRKISGTKTVELPHPEGATVRQMLQAAVARYPKMRERLLDERDQLGRHAHVFVNGRDAPLLDYGMDTPLVADDKIDVFPIGHF